MKAVILAAGLGTRLRPLTNTRSKVMIPVANKPILYWIYSSIKEIAKEIFIVVRKEQQDVKNFFSEYDVEFIYQEKPMGTAHAILQCKDYMNDRFLAINGDEFIPREDIQSLAKINDFTIACFPTSNPQNFGLLNISHNLVKGIEEKSLSLKNNLVSSGLYLLNESIFRAIEKTKLSKRNEYEITDSINILIREGEEIKAFLLNKWKTITYPWDLLDANAMILEQEGSQISENAEIRTGAYIEEPVAINESIIGPNCYIRKYSSIGKNCKIGNAVEIKNSIIMENSFVSHLSYVGDSIIGKNCNIGAGTIFANLRLDEKTVGMKVNGNIVDSGRKKLGGIVGDNVKFGVNCTVMPGKKIFPNLLIPPCIKITQDLEKQPRLK